MASRTTKFGFISTSTALLAALLVGAPATAADPSKMVDGVIYQAISANASDGAEVVGYDAGEISSKVVIRDYVKFQGEKYLVKRIGAHSLSSPSNMKFVTIPKTVRVIEENAFSFSHLKKVAIPDSVRTIGSRAFENCLQLTEVSLGKRVRSFGDSAISGTLIERLVLPASVDSVEDGAFTNNARLEFARFLGDAPSFGLGVFNGADPSFHVRYESRFDSTVGGGFTHNVWSGLSSFMYPEVTVKAPSKVKDGGKVSIKVLVRAGNIKVSAGLVKLRFAGKTKTFDINAPFSEKTFAIPNVSGSGKTYTAKAVYRGRPADKLLKNKGVKKIRVVE